MNTDVFIGSNIRNSQTLRCDALWRSIIDEIHAERLIVTGAAFHQSKPMNAVRAVSAWRYITIQKVLSRRTAHFHFIFFEPFVPCSSHSSVRHAVLVRTNKLLWPLSGLLKPTRSPV